MNFWLWESRLTSSLTHQFLFTHNKMPCVFQHSLLKTEWNFKKSSVLSWEYMSASYTSIFLYKKKDLTCFLWELPFFNEKNKTNNTYNLQISSWAFDATSNYKSLNICHRLHQCMKKLWTKFTIRTLTGVISVNSDFILQPATLSHGDLKFHGVSDEMMKREILRKKQP